MKFVLCNLGFPYTCLESMVIHYVLICIWFPLDTPVLTLDFVMRRSEFALSLGWLRFRSQNLQRLKVLAKSPLAFSWPITPTFQFSGELFHCFGLLFNFVRI